MDGKVFEKNIRKLTRAGAARSRKSQTTGGGKVSLSLTIPRELVVELGWKGNL
jgi:hypothetical protein